MVLRIFDLCSKTLSFGNKKENLCFLLFFAHLFVSLQPIRYNTYYNILRMKKKKNELVEAIVEGLQDKKGRDIVVADLTEIPDAVCRYFVICTGGSPLQVAALAHSVGDTCREKAAAKPIAVSGLHNAVWVAMDYAEVIVHIFVPELRSFYDIEHLWADADLQSIPNLD